MFSRLFSMFRYNEIVPALMAGNEAGSMKNIFLILGVLSTAYLLAKDWAEWIHSHV